MKEEEPPAVKEEEKKEEEAGLPLFFYGILNMLIRIQQEKSGSSLSEKFCSQKGAEERERGAIIYCWGSEFRKRIDSQSGE